MEVKKVKPTLYDPMIIPRVKQYLEENVHQTYVDVGVMARLLQERYREYSRRKSAPFRQLVEQAYKTVLHSYGLDSNPSSDDNDDISSDLEMMDDRADGNHMNNILTNMYVDNKGSGGGGGGGGGTGATNNEELIDISSEDSDDEDDVAHLPPKLKDANIPKTLHINQVTITKKPTSSSQNNDLTANTNVSSQGFSNTKVTIKPVSSTNNNVIASFGGVSALPHQHPSKKRKILEDMGHLRKTDNGRTDQTNQITPRSKNIKPELVLKKESQTTVSEVPASSSIPKTPQKKYKKEVAAQISQIKFKDIGGMEATLKQLCELLLHIKHPEVYRHIGLPPPRGFLLHGPPGCGKTLLAQAIAGQLDVCLIQVAATELVAGVSGESEERIRDLFEQAASVAPCVLFIDEIDAISSNRQNAQKDMERRMVAQLLSSLDGLSKYPNGDQVLIIGATNRPDALDPALRRVGRFDQEISLGIPDRSSREHILRVICAELLLDRPFDFDAIAALTPGYVGADLLALATRAASLAVKRLFSRKEEQSLRSKMFNNRYSSSKNIIPTVNLTEDALLSTTSIPPANHSKAIPTVNLIDDNLMMEIDAALETANTPDDIKINGATDENTTIPEQKDKLIGGCDEDTKLNGVEVDKKTDDISTEVIKSDEKPEKATVNDEPAATDDVPLVEQADEDITINEQVTDKEKNPDDGTNADESMVVDETDASKKINTEKTDDSKATNDDTEKSGTDKEDDIEAEIVDLDDVPDEETLDEALLKMNAGKIHLSLSEMTKWLSDEDPLIDEDGLADLSITMQDFNDAVKLVQPSAKREGFITVPDVTWDDIGALRDIREELQLAVLAPVKFPEKLLALGLQSPSGVLLCGPPGCGKTLLAKAVANEAGINFISVKGPELLNMYVGESERAVRQCFQRARNSAPCVIFFDEFDSLCPTRSTSSENNASSRVVNQLLTEMDGVEERKGVFLMAATNRPDIVDPAVLRPGRLDKILYVGLPGEKERSEILKAVTQKKPKLSADVNMDELAKLTDSYTGADLSGLVRQASLYALKDSIATSMSIDSKVTQPQTTNDSSLSVNRANFLKALTHIRPSVSAEDKKHYEKLRQKYIVSVPLNNDVNEDELLDDFE